MDKHVSAGGNLELGTKQLPPPQEKFEGAEYQQILPPLLAEAAPRLSHRCSPSKSLHQPKEASTQMRICTPDTEHHHGRCCQPPAVLSACPAQLRCCQTTHETCQGPCACTQAGELLDVRVQAAGNLTLLMISLLKIEQVLREWFCALGTLPVAVPGGCRGSACTDDSSMPAMCTYSERGGCELGFQTGEQQLHLKACKTLIKKK